MNIVYDIINKEDDHIIFNYVLIFIIFVLIFNNLHFNMMILVGLFFASIVVYYWYTYRLVNTISKEKIINNKFDTVNPNSNILVKYPDFVDFLFYIEDFKPFDIQNYENIVNKLQNFSEINNACIIDNVFINDYYNTLNNIKFNIIKDIGKFNYTTNSSTYSNKINNAQNKIEILLNSYIDKLITIQQNIIQKNGYNNTTKIIDTTNILPFNYLETNANVLY